MYNIAKLSEPSAQFLYNLPQYVAGNHELTSMALARAISSQLPMASGELEKPAEFYANTVLVTTREAVSMFSDIMAGVNCERVLELIRTLWMVRYSLAFPGAMIYSTLNMDTESVFLGYGSVLAAPDITFIKENTQKLVLMHNAFAKMIQEINGITPAEAAQTEAAVIGV